MDDQRQAGFPCCRDMGSETGLLQVARAVVVEIIESGFADADHLRVLRPRYQVFDGHDRFFLGLVRVNADRTPDIVVCLGDRAYFIEPGHPCADGDHGADTGVAGALNGFVPIFVEDVEIKMAMAVDKHVARLSDV